MLVFFQTRPMESLILRNTLHSERTETPMICLDNMDGFIGRVKQRKIFIGQSHKPYNFKETFFY